MFPGVVVRPCYEQRGALGLGLFERRGRKDVRRVVSRVWVCYHGTRLRSEARTRLSAV